MSLVQTIIDIWNYKPRRGYDRETTCIKNIAKKLECSMEDLIVKLVSEFKVHEVQPPKLCVSTTIHDVVMWLELVAARRRRIIHVKDCGFEDAVGKEIRVSESDGEHEAYGTAELEGTLMTWPMLNMSTGYDSIRIVFRFCPECGVAFDTLTLLRASN